MLRQLYTTPGLAPVRRPRDAEDFHIFYHAWNDADGRDDACRSLVLAHQVRVQVRSRAAGACVAARACAWVDQTGHSRHSSGDGSPGGLRERS